MYNSFLPFAFDESIRSRYPIDSTNSASCADFSIEYLKKLSDVKRTRRPARGKKKEFDHLGKYGNGD